MLLRNKAHQGGVQITQINKIDDIRTFFNDIALNYKEQHGNSDRLLRYRTNLIARLADIRSNDIVLEVCCGLGNHLMIVSKNAYAGIGIDLSPEMIHHANINFKNETPLVNLQFNVDDATVMKTIESESVDVAFCVGSIEHIPDKKSVLSSVSRVLKRNGRFVCLTVNGEYIWYDKIAPFFNFNTRHLSTDKFLIPGEINQLISNTDLSLEKMGYWSFIPRGDMPKLFAFLLSILDLFGKLFYIRNLRGGIYFTVKKG
jgi:ubiquinone/menaquinone biosynthesis C-methylase UbiE